MNWDKTGLKVRGRYMDLFDVAGTVVESRVTYGGGVKHTVELNNPRNIFGTTRTHVLLMDTELMNWG